MKRVFVPALLLLSVAGARGDEPCRSGLQPGQRPGPYSAVVAVGPQRGTQHCYVCEAGDRPVVIVFARSLTEPLGKLVKRVDALAAEPRAADLRAWVTFLAEDQPSFDPKVVQWGKEHAIRAVPLGVYEDPVGPPAYRLAREADVTVLVATKQRVVANFAFRAGELDDAAIDAIARTIQNNLSTKDTKESNEE
jgi:hypothetical protein